MSGGKQKEKSVWKPPEVVHIFDNLWDLKPIGMKLFWVYLLVKQKGNIKPVPFAFFHFYINKKILEKAQST